MNIQNLIVRYPDHLDHHHRHLELGNVSNSGTVEQWNSRTAPQQLPFQTCWSPGCKRQRGKNSSYFCPLVFGHHLVKPISLHSASGFGWNCVRIGRAFLGRRSEVFKAWRAEVRIWGLLAATERTGCNYRGVSCTTVSSILLGGQ